MTERRCRTTDLNSFTADFTNGVSAVSCCCTCCINSIFQFGFVTAFLLKLNSTIYCCERNITLCYISNIILVNT